MKLSWTNCKSATSNIQIFRTMASKIVVSFVFILAICGVILLVQKSNAEPTTRTKEALKGPPIKLDSLVPIYETNTAFYSLAEIAEDPKTADIICHKNKGHLISFQNLDEVTALVSKLKSITRLTADLIWTSGIAFSNSTVEELLLWSETNEPINFNNFHDEENHFSDSARNRREVVSVINETIEEECNCSCTNSPTTPAPFTRAPCKKPTCHISIPNPQCTENRQRNCSLTGTPNCHVTQRNCTVDCNTPCRVVEQPRCTIKSPTRPRCVLKPPRPCETSQPNCTVVNPGTCRSEETKCIQQDDNSCKPVIRPCQNPCTKPECTTVQPPCVTSQPPCTTVVPATCPTVQPPCRKEEKCRQKRGSLTNGTDIECKVVEVCLNTTSNCKPVTSCPPVQTSCPPAVTTCSRPFVDCSPEICQSSVQICMPPKIVCPPPKIICDPPEVRCEDAVSQCPEPEVECGEPELECTRPKVECPDALVHCDPMITSCDHAPVSCTEPDMTCKHPQVTCDEPVTCPQDGPSETYSPCCRGKKCSRGKGKKLKEREMGRKRDSLMLPSEAEFVEKTMCIAMKKDLGFKWVVQSCSLKYNYICKFDKALS